MKENTPSPILEVLKKPQKQHNIKIRLNTATTKMLNDCLATIKSISGVQHSRPYIIRTIIDLYSDLRHRNKLIPNDELLSFTSDIDEWLNANADNHIPMVITEEQRITLRKLEFDTQSLDWARNIDRNSAVQILIMSYGCIIKSTS
jgi:hypothetical protein